MSYLGLDIGSTSIKGAVLDPVVGTVTGILKEPFPEPVHGLPPLWFEVDPQAVLDGVQRVLSRLLPLAPECQGIVCCGQMGGVILTDQQRRPVSNYLSWRDQRTTCPTTSHSEPLFSRLKHQLTGDDWATLGRELQPGSATSLLAWRQEAGVVTAGDIPMSLGDFITSQLCGSLPVTEFTAAIGLLNLQTRTWHDSVFAKLNLDSLAWPKLQSWQTPVGEMQHGRQRIPVYPCVGDHQCALAGVGLAAGELSINISTGSQVAMLTPTWMPGDYQTRAFLDHRFLNTITHIPAGRALNVLVDLLTELALAEGVTLTKSWDTVAQRVAQARESSLHVNLAFFAGPLGDHGQITGITTENLTVGSLFRAAYRHMAENYALLAHRLVPTGDWNSVMLSGGLAQSMPVLRQFLAEELPSHYRLCLNTEDTLHGLLAMTRGLSGRSTTLNAG